MTDTNYKFEVGEWYKTRNGWSAQILDDDFKGPDGKVLVGKVQNEIGFEFVRAWHEDGRWSKDRESGIDLMPPVETKEFWINLYGDYISGGYASNPIADEFASNRRIGLLKITITGDKYEVEKVAI